MASMVQNLNFITFNVRGLKNKTKRNSILNLLKTYKNSIIALQETYINENDIRIIEKEWGGEIHFSNARGRSNGLITLFSKNIPFEKVKCVIAEERILLSKINFGSYVIYIVNVYSPCINSEKPVFLRQVSEAIEKYTELTNIVCLGDFNMVLDNKLDIVSGGCHTISNIESFKNFKLKGNLIDTWRYLHPYEKNYTWRGGATNAARRLDYIFISADLVDCLKKTEISSFGFSDHRSVHCNLTFSDFQRGPSYYKLNTSLLMDEVYVKLINETIEYTKDRYESLDPSLKWEMIKNAVVTESQQYSRFKHINKQNKILELLDELNFLDEKFKNSENEEKAILVTKINSAKEKLEIYKHYQTRGAQIRARVKWVEEGEKNSRYFFGLEKKRVNDNTLRSVFDENDVPIYSEHSILEKIYSHFEKLYTEKNNQAYFANNFEKFTENLFIPKISEEEKLYCDLEFTEEEVSLALKSLKNGSSPGLDGLPTEFYKFFWDKLKQPLIESFRHSFLEGSLSPSQRLGMLFLLHKGNDLNKQKIENWRPIALTNVDYKIITKVLATRIKTVINCIVGENQYGFIPGRKMGDFIHNIDNITSYLRTFKKSGLLLSVDFEKAFDTISVSFIIKTFKSYGFGNYFIKWLETVLSDRKCCVQNGGYISKAFNMNRGVRQGCPLSPLLFVMAAEILAYAIKQKSDIQGISLPANENIKIMQYADDTTFFPNDENDMKIFLDVLNNFTTISGLKINKNKSSYISYNPMYDVAEQALQISRVERVKILVVYFSSLSDSQHISENWTPKIYKIEKLLISWAKRDLSIWGKILIIKTLCISMLTLIIQSITLPNEALSRLNQLFFKFIWKKRYNNKKAFEKVKRKIMYLTYEEGGLQMLDIKHFQNSFILERVKRLREEVHNQWKTIPVYFLKQVGGLNAFDCFVEGKDFKGAELINNNYWKRALHLWLDFSFEGKLNNSILLQPIFNHSKITYKNETLFIQKCINQRLILIKDYIVENRIITMEEFRQKIGRYPRLELDYNLISNAILRNKNLILDSQEADISDKVQLNRKIIYQLIKVAEIPHVIQLWRRKYNIELDRNFWKLAIEASKETRLRILHWKILHNIWPTNILLSRMNIVPNINCQICQEVDYLEHFFVNCKKIKHLWNHVQNKLSIYFNSRIELTERMKLLGVTNNDGFITKQVSKINHTILIAKMSISKLKFGLSKNIIHIFEKEALIRKVLS